MAIDIVYMDGVIIGNNQEQQCTPRGCEFCVFEERSVADSFPIAVLLKVTAQELDRAGYGP